MTACVVGGVACATNPATGGRMLSLVNEAQEISIGRDADAEIVAAMGLYADSAVQQQVRELGLALAAASERPDLPWTFRVLDDPTVNAFALPGGFVYVTRGILAHMTSEAQLAGVLGHEIGHVTARHSVARMSRAQLTQFGVALGALLSETVRRHSDLLDVGAGLLFLKFSRDDEREADVLGVRYMTRLGYAPAELASVMRMLGQASELDGGGRVPEWASTHPDPANRSETIARMADAPEAADATLVRRAEFLAMLEGMSFGADPREGFVRDSLFLHPDLAFRISTGGWSVYNERTQVRFMAPDEDAALVLSLVEGDLAQAATDFAARDGVQPQARVAVEVNGLEAMRMAFGLRGDGTAFEGEALFVAYGGAIYQIVGLATAARWPDRRDAIRAVQGSFREETDPTVLARQPDRIAIVALPAPMSFADFLARHPSVIDDARAALINQVDTGVVLDPGPWKRVVAGN